MGHSIQEVLATHGSTFLASNSTTEAQRRALHHILLCKTTGLGGHMDVCPECGITTYHFNSCRDRHCPKCQGYMQAIWVDARAQEMLNIGYFHIVFTIPQELNPLVYANQKELYSLLFRCTWETVDEFAQNKKYLGAKVGATSVLHTWGRTLQLHPHIHMIVTSGGLTEKNGWRSCGKNFFAPVKAMSSVFKAKFISAIRKLARKGRLTFCDTCPKERLNTLLDSVYQKPWVVYAKAPFKDAGCLLKYLGQYTHRAAISDARILEVTDTSVTFAYRDVHDNKQKQMTLDACEFLRRFCMHILPKGLTRKRHYGILSGRGKHERLDLCKRLTSTPIKPYVSLKPFDIVMHMLGRDPRYCDVCNCKLKTYVIKPCEVFRC